MLSLENRIVLITGASSGIGAACAAIFAQAGCRIILCARRQKRLTEVGQRIQAEHNTGVLTLELDVRDRPTTSRVLNNLPPEWKTVDVLVNNAGLALGKAKMQEADEDEWETMIDTNIKGLLNVTRAVLPGMIERRAGHVINIGSIAGQEVYPGGSVYAATKHAVHALSRALHMDVLGSQVRVSCVAPGFVETEFSLVRFAGDREKADEVYRGMVPLTAEDVADAVFYCATRPAHVNISELVLKPTDQASVAHIHRRS